MAVRTPVDGRKARRAWLGAGSRAGSQMSKDCEAILTLDCVTCDANIYLVRTNAS
jgi:hypothetical protein